MDDMDEMDDLKETFIIECYELVELMEGGLLAVNSEDEDADNSEALNSIFRGAHSIKGGSGALGFMEMYQFTHTLEALLDAMREGDVYPDSEKVDSLLSAVDIVKQMVDFAQSGEAVPSGLGDELSVELVQYAGGDIAKAPGMDDGLEVEGGGGSSDIKVYKIHFVPSQELFATGNEPLLILKAINEAGEAEIVPDLDKFPPFAEMDYELCYFSWNITLKTTLSENEIQEFFEFVEDISEVSITQEAGEGAKEELPEQPDIKPKQAAEKKDSPVKEVKKPTPQAVTSIRVDVHKVDTMINMIGELVITQSMLASHAENMDVEMSPNFVLGMDDLSRHTRELQQAVMAVRMQPVKSVFSRMPRLVRDLSKKLGKKMKLVTSGEATEVDKTIVEQLSDPLTHMIRNSIDHGIEMPDVRVENGKPEEGTIYLSADHSGGKIIIEISDDGAGINRERVLAKAKEKGLVSMDANISDEEIDNLVFHPGFSTTDEVSEISGRGVGMDVVNSNIRDIGGSIIVENNPGVGLKLTIFLPLTLAILDGMVVSVGEEKYIIPIGGIVETLQPKEEDVQTIAEGNMLLSVRGEYLPLLSLHSVFDIDDAERDIADVLVVIVENARQKFGVLVDGLLGQQQVVIKNLEENSDPIQGVSGATILGDGEVSLILDMAGLWDIVSVRQGVSGGRTLKAVAS